MAVRRLAHGMGYRFRLHCRGLPGTPDLVFPRLRKVIFVHGCFWHQHGCRLGAKKPSVNQQYWLPKLDRNIQRDIQSQTLLKDLGWQALTVWECETRSPETLPRVIAEFLGSSAAD